MSLIAGAHLGSAQRLGAMLTLIRVKDHIAHVREQHSTADAELGEALTEAIDALSDAIRILADGVPE